MSKFYTLPDRSNPAIGTISKKVRPESASASSDFRCANGSQLAARAKKIKVTLPKVDWGNKEPRDDGK